MATTNMTKLTPEQYEELRSKIIEAVPEILELKLGCEVEITEILESTGPAPFNPEGKDCTYQHKEKIVKCEYNRHPAKFGGYYLFILSDGVLRELEEDEFKQTVKILGRDIGLEDILRAIEKNAFQPGRLSAGGGTMEYRTQIDSNKIMAMRKWKYGQPLHLQSDEVKVFLYNILK